MYLVQIDFILLYEYQGFILPVFPLAPHGSVYSLGLLFRTDKQVFFVYGNYCLRIVSNATRLSMRRLAGGRGDVMRGNIDQPPECFLLQL